MKRKLKGKIYGGLNDNIRYKILFKDSKKVGGYSIENERDGWFWYMDLEEFKTDSEVIADVEIKDLPEKLNEMFSDPLLEIEFWRWKESERV